MGLDLLLAIKIRLLHNGDYDRRAGGVPVLEVAHRLSEPQLT